MLRQIFYLRGGKMKKQLIILCIALVSLMAFFFLRRPMPSHSFVPAAVLENAEEAPAVEILPLEVPQMVIVDLKGSVQHPGIYEVEISARVHDVILMAGGLTEEAAAQWVNLAQRVSDEMVIFIPSIHDGEIVGQGLALGPPQEEGVVSINRATASELQSLPGIGATRAEAIIRYREEVGGFSQLEDLRNVSGIGVSTFENIKHLIGL